MDPRVREDDDLRVPSINTSSPVSLCPPNSHFQPPPTPVIPAKAGIQAVSRLTSACQPEEKTEWIPAFARMTVLWVQGINISYPVSLCPPNSHFQPTPPYPSFPRRRESKRSRGSLHLLSLTRIQMDPRVREDDGAVGQGVSRLAIAPYRTPSKFTPELTAFTPSPLTDPFPRKRESILTFFAPPASHQSNLSPIINPTHKTRPI